MVLFGTISPSESREPKVVQVGERSYLTHCKQLLQGLLPYQCWNITYTRSYAAYFPGNTVILPAFASRWMIWAS